MPNQTLTRPLEEQGYRFEAGEQIAPKPRVGAAAMSRGGDRGGSTRQRIHAPPPPQRVARTQNAALAGAIIKEVASPIIDTILKLITAAAGDDIEYTVPKLEGLKHVNDDPANRGNGAMQTATLDLQMPRQGVGSWPFDREIYLDFRVTWQYDGRSLGNIFVQRSKAVDAAGWGLTVKSDLLNDAATYRSPDGSGSTFAAIKLLFESTFSGTVPWENDSIALTHVTLFGNGRTDIRHEWTQTP